MTGSDDLDRPSDCTTPEGELPSDGNYCSTAVFSELRTYQLELKAQNEELRETQQRLQESLDRYSNLHEFAPVGYVSLDQNGCILKINLTGSIMLYLPRTQIVGRPFVHFIDEGDTHIFRSYLDSLSRSPGDSHLIEVRIKSRDDKTCSVLIESSPLINEGRHIVMTDISNLKDAAHRNQNLIRENRLLTQNLFKVQEDESKYLAREIHDELGQWMTAILAEAEILSANNEQNAVNQASANAISNCVGKMHQVVRHLMGHLRPTTLDILGLKDSLSELMEEWRSHHPKVRLDHLLEGHFEDIRDPVNITVYRIMQEALNNISKYAHATRVKVRLARNEDNTIGADHISLSIEDNGRGFSPTQKSDGMGLLGMRERALTLGGEFKFISSLGNGTRIEVKLPREFQGKRRKGDI